MSGIQSVAFADAQKVADEVVRRYEAGEFDVAHLFYARFQSALVQEPVGRQIIPVAIDTGAEAAPASAAAVEYEPDEESILADLLPRNIAIQIFGALLENAASEQGSRMTARSEEHTSELQSLMRISYAVFCLKKKKKTTTT